MIGICEAMNLGKSLGIDTVTLAEVMNTSTAACWSCDINNPDADVSKAKGMGASANDYNGGFASKLMLKDLRLAIDAGQSSGVALPLGTNAMELYKLLALRGFGEKDFGVMLEFLKGK